MEYVKCDARGRVYLKETVRQHYGSVFYMLEGPDELIFLPIPKNPVKDLARIGQKLKGKSIKSLKAAIKSQAESDLR